MPALLIVIGLLGELFVSISMLQEWQTLGAIALVSFGVAVLGSLFLLAGSAKLGAKLVFIGSVLFVPLGLVAIVGARKVLDAENEAELELRRRDA
jgi:hypothetical protein